MKQQYDQAPTATSTLTVTGLSTLANNTQATSNVIDNYNAGQANYDDFLFTTSVTSAGSSVSATGYLEVYVQGSLDNSVFGSAGFGTLVGVVPITANSTTYPFNFSISRAWGGLMYPYFKLVFNNQSGAALTAASVKYNGVYWV